MKKIILKSLTFGVLISCLALSVPVLADTIERGYVSITTSANTEVVPDIADVSIAVQTYDSKSLQKAR